MGQYGAIATRTLWKTFAWFGQYLLPFLSLVGAAMSAWRRRQRSRLAAEVAQNPSADALDGMSWREFEMLVGEGFRLQGFRVVETGGGGADGGVDLVLSRPGQNGSEKDSSRTKPFSDFVAHASEVLAEVAEQRQPLVITET